MVEHERGTDTSGDGSDANITKGIVAFLKARDVHINSGAAGFVAAQGNFSISNGGAGPVFANGDVKIRSAGAVRCSRAAISRS